MLQKLRNKLVFGEFLSMFCYCYQEQRPFSFCYCLHEEMILTFCSSPHSGWNTWSVYLWWLDSSIISLHRLKDRGSIKPFPLKNIILILLILKIFLAIYHRWTWISASLSFLLIFSNAFADFSKKIYIFFFFLVWGLNGQVRFVFVFLKTQAKCDEKLKAGWLQRGLPAISY